MAKVLLIDDDVILLRMYQKKLEQVGYEVQVGSSGLQGLERAMEQKPDLILCDIMMPEMDGLTFLSKIKAMETLKDVPVVMLTNVSGSDTDGQEAIEKGAVAYMVKASNRPSVVVEKVKELVDAYVKEVPKAVSVNS